MTPKSLALHPLERSQLKAKTTACAASSSSMPVPQEDDSPGPLESALLSGARLFTQLFPLWCILAALSGFYHPPLYTWFSTSMTTNGLMFIMVRLGPSRATRALTHMD